MTSTTADQPHTVIWRNATGCGLITRTYPTLPEAQLRAASFRPWNNTATTVRPVPPPTPTVERDGLTITGPARPYGSFTITGERARGGTMTVGIRADSARLVGVRADIPECARDDKGVAIDRRDWAMVRTEFAVSPMCTEPRTPVGPYSERYLSNLPAALQVAQRFIRG